MKNKYFKCNFKNGYIRDFDRRCTYIEPFVNLEGMVVFRESARGNIISVINTSEISHIDLVAD